MLLLAGWGLVGLSSYLLIGYWHEHKAPVEAAKKAFVMNAIGDVGIAMPSSSWCATSAAPTSTRCSRRPRGRGRRAARPPNWVALALLPSAPSPSRAQIPLHTWLPDAMEGPTPVSALIHAATMVTAGVYLVRAHARAVRHAPNVQALVGRDRRARRC